jgi:GTP-binding protein
MTSLLRQAVFQQSAEKLNQLPAESIAEVAFAGRSNAGKSSALNILTGKRKLAHVSKTPGRTRLINFFQVANGAFLVDLPGYGYAQVPGDMKRNWARLLTGYLGSRPQICGLVVIMDARHPMKPIDVQLLDWFKVTGKPVHVLLTKADKLSKSQAASQLAKAEAILRDEYEEYTVQLFSSASRLGLKQADAIINGWFRTWVDVEQ